MLSNYIPQNSLFCWHWQLVQGIAGSGLRLDHQAPIVDSQTDLGTRTEVQDIQDRWRYGQHDRAADFAQVRGVHGYPQELYMADSNFITNTA